MIGELGLRFMGAALRLAAILMAVLASTPAAAENLLQELNAIRAQGCLGQPGAETSVRSSRALDGVARHLARGAALPTALERGRYRAQNSVSIHLEGSREISALKQALREDHCTAVTQPAFSEAGTYRRGRHTWIVLAEPFSPPSPGEQEAVARQVLELVNAARGRGVRCGGERHAPAGPLELSATLSKVALAHARDMAARSAMSHRGSDGSQPADRVTRSGYRWRYTAENVAAGQPDAATVVEHWLNSPGHCATIMGAQYTEVGVAYAVKDESDAGIYWAQVFATPR